MYNYLIFRNINCYVNASVYIILHNTQFKQLIDKYNINTTTFLLNGINLYNGININYNNIREQFIKFYTDYFNNTTTPIDFYTANNDLYNYIKIYYPINQFHDMFNYFNILIILLQNVFTEIKNTSIFDIFFTIDYTNQRIYCINDDTNFNINNLQDYTIKTKLDINIHSNILNKYNQFIYCKLIHYNVHYHIITFNDIHVTCIDVSQIIYLKFYSFKTTDITFHIDNYHLINIETHIITNSIIFKINLTDYKLKIPFIIDLTNINTKLQLVSFVKYINFNHYFFTLYDNNKLFTFNPNCEEQKISNNDYIIETDIVYLIYKLI